MAIGLIPFSLAQEASLRRMLTELPGVRAAADADVILFKRVTDDLKLEGELKADLASTEIWTRWRATQRMREVVAFPEMGERIVHLDLTNCALMVIPSAIKCFLNLETLKLGHNDLSEIPCDAFNGLKKLHTIHLEYNHRLTLIADNAFRGCPALRNLNLTHNPPGLDAMLATSGLGS